MVNIILFFKSTSFSSPVGALLLLLFLFTACNSKKENSPPVHSSTIKTFAPIANDSTITEEQYTTWLRCNPLLDSLSYRYADSFSAQNYERFQHFQEQFVKAQDSICRQSGLTGGYEEYQWILQRLGAKENRDRLDSLR